MTTIEFSFIPDADRDYDAITRLMADFKRETGVEVHLRRMEWGNAWPQLIGIATQGRQPNEIALATRPACVPTSTTTCPPPRMFVSMRMYDADAERATGERPGWDVGGRLVVLDLPESSVGGPEPRWVRSLEIGQIAGPLLVILVSGRPMIINEALKKSSAFIAAWLPGTEGEGIADVIFGDYKPTGKLSFSWPDSMWQVPVNPGDGKKPLFPFGYGLTY